MFPYLADIWRRRHFVLSLVRIDLQNRYRRSVLGVGWSLLHPLAMTAVLCLVFHTIFQLNVREYAPFLLVGLACWQFIVSVSLQGCRTFCSAEAYIRQCPAPMAIYPLRTTLGAIVHFFVALSLAIGLTWCFNGCKHPLALACLVPTMGLLVLFCWSLATFCGLGCVFFRDTQHLADIGFQILFYATPVMYPASRLDHGRFAWVVHYNPFVPFLDLLRGPILEGQVPAPGTYLLAGGITLVSTLLAALALGRLEKKLIFYL